MYIRYFVFIIKKITKLTLTSLVTCAYLPGADPGGVPGARPPLTTKNEAPAPKFYKTEAPEWQF